MRWAAVLLLFGCAATGSQSGKETAVETRVEAHCTECDIVIDIKGRGNMDDAEAEAEVGP